MKAYESTVFGECSDVPLKLEILFGIVSASTANKVPGQAAAEAIAAADSAKARVAAKNVASFSNPAGGNNQEEEEKSEAKALADADE